MYRVEFPDLETLNAAVEAVSAANSATGDPDNADTPIFRAERVLDLALLEGENAEAAAEGIG